MNLHDRILRLSWSVPEHMRTEVADLARAVEILERQVAQIERESDARGWQTGTPPEAGKYLIRTPNRTTLDTWDITRREWVSTPDENVLGWMAIPVWEGR